jgi:predicted MPP superfamily phosphohydrolase
VDGNPSFSDQAVPFDQRLINRRQVWAMNRFWMEMQNLKTKRYGKKGLHHWYQFLVMVKVFKLLLHFTGLYGRGIRNAQNIVLKEIPLYFSNLPAPFEGFTILHLSDLHLDCMKGIEDQILNTIAGRSVDLCVLTGDYRTELHGLHKHIIESLKYLIDRIDTREGFIGILGNHDSCHMVNPMEKIGINMLINSREFIHRQKAQIQIIGTDDVHYYYTDQALHALEHAGNDFTIALIHSLELHKVAAELGVDLYLCGHTHAGQVCLPGGIPIFTHSAGGRRYSHGHWKYMDMQGITHAGVGTSAIPVRFNSQGEILIYTLHKR